MISGNVLLFKDIKIITGHLIGVENSASVNFVDTLSFRGGKRSFGFKRLLELVWTRLSSIDEIVSIRGKLCKTSE